MESRTAPRKYSFASHGSVSSGGGLPGHYLLKPGAGRCYKPAWGVGAPPKDGITVIRPLPHLEDDGKGGRQWTPFRNSATGLDYGDWIRSYRAVRGIGPEQNTCTYIVSDPLLAGDGVDMQYPSDVLYDNILRSVKAGQARPEWAPLVIGQNGRSAPLRPSEDLYLVKAAIVYLNGTPHINPPKGIVDQPVVMEMSGSAGRALLQAVSEPVTDATRAAREASGYSSPWDMQFEAGDPIALDQGAFITFYKSTDGHPDERQARPQQFGGATMQMGFGQGPGAQAAAPQGFPKFAAYARKEFNGIPANFLATPEWQNALAQTQKDWEQLLYFPPVEKQVEILAIRFPWSAIEYAFQNRPDWLQVARAVTGNTTTVPMWAAAPAALPAGPAMPAMPAMPAGPAMPAMPAMHAGPAMHAAPAAPAMHAAPAAPAPQPNVFNTMSGPMTIGNTGAPPLMGASSFTVAAPPSHTTMMPMATLAQPPAGGVTLTQSPAPPAVAPGLAAAINFGQAPAAPGGAQPPAGVYAQGPFGAQPAAGFITPPAGFAPPAPPAAAPAARDSRGQLALQIAEQEMTDIPF